MDASSHDAGIELSSFSVSTLDVDKHDREFWLSTTPDERLAVAEYMRQVIYGYDPVNDRVDRVLTVINLNDYFAPHAN